MENKPFDGRAIRRSVKPKMTMREMARKMGVASSYLWYLESGRHVNWPPQRKRDFLRIISEWKKNPTPKPRKKRTAKPKNPPLPVPHPHGEIVGIG